MGTGSHWGAALTAAAFLLGACSAHGANTPPKIAGTPAPDVTVGDTYLFKPVASDAEQPKLKFAISGKPAWATFDALTGELRGAPSEAHAGFHSGITISVSDGKHITSLASFTVTVLPPPVIVPPPPVEPPPVVPPPVIQPPLVVEPPPPVVEPPPVMPPPVVEAAVARRKAAYGHYFATRYTDTAVDVKLLCEQPGVRGVVWRRTWGEVETAPGIYDFSSFDDVLATIAASANPECQLWIFVEFKSFANSPFRNPCPEYLRAQYSGLNADGSGAATCFMWEPVVVQAYVAMMQAAASRYDANPRVEGLILQESALGFNGQYAKEPASGGTYSAEAWRDALIVLVGECGKAFANSRCLSFLNFLRGGQAYLYDVSAAIAAIPDNRGCISGPDLLPDEQTLYANQASIYEVITRHVGCRSNSAQNNSFAVPGCDLECIFRFGVSGTFGDFSQDAPRLGGVCVNSYLFWNHRVVASPTGLDWTDALPVIAANPYGAGWLEQCAGGGGAP